MFCSIIKEQKLLILALPKSTNKIRRNKDIMWVAHYMNLHKPYKAMFTLLETIFGLLESWPMRCSMGKHPGNAELKLNLSVKLLEFLFLSRNQ